MRPFPCDYCRRPMMVVKPPPKGENGTRKKGWTSVVGPDTHPKIKRWCDGSCDGLALHFLVIKENAKKAFEDDKHLRWLLLTLERFECELEEYLRARDKDRVPISEKARKVLDKLRRLKSRKSKEKS